MKRLKNQHLRASEDDLVARIAADLPRQAASHGFLRLGIGDDAALLKARPRHDFILTCDWLLEGTHFLPHKHSADAIGWKCLARAVSDIAAMGGRPLCFLLSLGLPAKRTGTWLDDFLKGLERSAKTLGGVWGRPKRNIELIGGDTTRTKRLIINVTVAGEIRAHRGVLRSGARPGDIIFVTGRLGEAELGLRTLLTRRRTPVGTTAAAALRKHLYPVPRLGVGRWLAEKGLATAMMDLSDGLSTDLPRLCAASKVGARIEEARLPKVVLGRESTRGEAERLELALNGGDDYELLFTASRRKARRIPSALHGVPLTAIGEITRKKDLAVVDLEGRTRTLLKGGWDPFHGK